MVEPTEPPGAGQPPQETPRLIIKGANPGDEILAVNGLGVFLNATYISNWLRATKAQAIQLHLSEGLRKKIKEWELGELGLARAKGELIPTSEPTPTIHTVWTDNAITFLEGHYRIRAAVDLGRVSYPSYRLPYRLISRMEVKYYLRATRGPLKSVPYTAAVQIIKELQRKERASK